jgi:large subunit ribosomal protein L18
MRNVHRTIRRRRHEGKTDYAMRLRALGSTDARVVFRKTNRYLIGQIVTSQVAQDNVLVSVTTKDLLAQGWPENLNGSLKSLPAAYLLGCLLAAKSKKIRNGVLDIGLNRHVPKSRIYAFVKGMIDSGFDIPCSSDVLPDQKLLEKKPETAKLINQLKGKLH